MALLGIFHQKSSQAVRNPPKLIFLVQELFYISCFTFNFNFSNYFIFLLRLTGYAVFYGDNYVEILTKNKECEIDFNFQEMNCNISPEG